MDRFWMGGDRGVMGVDVQRDGIRRGAAVYVRIRWVMAMGAGLRTRMVRRGCASGLVALRGPLRVDRARARNSDIWSAVGIFQDHAWWERMTALRIRVLGAEAVVGVADQRGRYEGSDEGLAGERVDPVGGAGTGGKIMCDGLGIRCILSHCELLAKKQKEAGRATGGPGLYTSLSFSFFYLSEKPKLNRFGTPQRVSNEVRPSSHNNCPLSLLRSLLTAVDVAPRSRS